MFNSSRFRTELCILEKMSLNPQEFVNDLLCKICSQLMDDPTVLECGHCFCNYCLKSHLQQNSSCPTCNVQVNKGLIIRSNILSSFIGRLASTLPESDRQNRETIISGRRLKRMKGRKKNIKSCCKGKASSTSQPSPLSSSSVSSSTDTSVKVEDMIKKDALPMVGKTPASLPSSSSSSVPNSATQSTPEILTATDSKLKSPRRSIRGVGRGRKRSGRTRSRKIISAATRRRSRRGQRGRSRGRRVGGKRGSRIVTRSSSQQSTGRRGSPKRRGRRSSSRIRSPRIRFTIPFDNFRHLLNGLQPAIPAPLPAQSTHSPTTLHAPLQGPLPVPGQSPTATPTSRLKYIRKRRKQ